MRKALSSLPAPVKNGSRERGRAWDLLQKQRGWLLAWCLEAGLCVIEESLWLACPQASQLRVASPRHLAELSSTECLGSGAWHICVWIPVPQLPGAVYIEHPSLLVKPLGVKRSLVNFAFGGGLFRHLKHFKGHVVVDLECLYFITKIIECSIDVLVLCSWGLLKLLMSSCAEKYGALTSSCWVFFHAWQWIFVAVGDLICG